MKKLLVILVSIVSCLAGIGALSAMQPASSTALSSGTAPVASPSKGTSTAIAVVSPIKTDDKKESKEEKKLAQQSRVVLPKVKPMAVDLLIDESKMSADQLYDRGMCFYSGRGVAQDYKAAVALFARAAALGHGMALSSLGFCLKNRRGVEEKDYSRLVAVLQERADNGDVGAAMQIGVYLVDDLENEQDEKPAEDTIQSLEKAAEGGSAVAMCNLGVRMLTDNSNACDLIGGGEWITKAAEKGSARAQCILGSCLLSGACGYVIDKPRAVMLFERAADKGATEALVYLSHCHAYGLGVEKSEDKAAAYRTRAVATRGEESVKKDLATFVAQQLGFADKSFTPRTCREATNQQNAACPICLGELYPGMQVQRCINGHCSHTACMERWEQQKGYPECPSCRSDRIADGKVAGKDDVVDNKTGYSTSSWWCVIS